MQKTLLRVNSLHSMRKSSYQPEKAHTIQRSEILEPLKDVMKTEDQFFN